MENKGEIILYKNQVGNIKINVRLEDDTVWLNQKQIALLFGKGRTTIVEHIGNVFKEGELNENVVCRNFRHTTQHGAIQDKTQEKDEETIKFFKIIQNKLLWAISEQTAAELVYRRVDASQPLMGMVSFDKKTGKNIKKTDVSIAKNYLNEKEIKLLGLLVEQYLAFAETMAQQQTPMYMKDWIKQLDIILKMNKRELLQHAGKISHEKALKKSEIEFNKFKTKQKIFEKEESLKEIEQDIKKFKNKKHKS